MSSNLYTTDNPVFSAYLFYCGILVLKVLMMAPLTGRYRFAKRIFANPEDKLPRSIVKYDDPDIERVRRAHLNDLENIPVFMVSALLYIATKPSYWLALNLFRAFTIARIIHTLVYAVVVIPQPARALAWAVGYAATIYIAVQVILFSLS